MFIVIVPESGNDAFEPRFGITRSVVVCWTVIVDVEVLTSVVYVVVWLLFPVPFSVCVPVSSPLSVWSS